MASTSTPRVVVTGLGVLTPIGVGRQAFADALRQGRSGIRPITLFSTTGHRHKLGGEVVDFDPRRYFDRRELRRMDRASQLVLAAAREAVESSGIDFSAEDPLRCGALVGTTLGGMISGEEYHRLARSGRYRCSLLLDFPLHSVVDRMAIAFGLQGPTLVFSTACASGAHAIAHGCNLIRSGRANVILAGGVDVMSEFTHAGFSALHTVIKEDQQIRPFDKRRCGFALGEGAAIVVLERLEHALARSADIYCQVAGYGMSSDAYHMTAPDRNGGGAARAMSAALRQAGLEPDRVDYINAHGTGTKYNDAAETLGIKAAFGEHAYRVAVSSTKSMIGHTLGASGAIELVAAVLAMREGFLPATINYETPDPECDLDYVPNVARRQAVDFALSNSFGFGGANVSILLGRSNGSAS